MDEARGVRLEPAGEAWDVAPHGNGAVRDRPRRVLLILHQPHSTPGHVGRWLALNGYALDIRRPRFGDPLPTTMDDHAGAVIFGGPMSANDPDDFIRQETDWIEVPLREGAPFLGICLGAQMLSRHLGGAVAEHPEKVVEVGYFPIKPRQEAAHLGPWPQRVYHWHREGFDVPRDATVLAEADGAFTNQAFAYRGSAVGLQFHPEITYAMVNRWTGYNPARLTQRGACCRAEQLADHVHHAPHVERWRDAFLRRWLAGQCG